MTDQEVKQVYNSARWQQVRDRILIRIGMSVRIVFKGCGRQQKKKKDYSGKMQRSGGRHRSIISRN